MINPLKLALLSLLGSALVVMALLLIPVPVANPPRSQKPQPAVRGTIKDPEQRAKEEEKRRQEKLEREKERIREELRKKLEEEKKRFEEELRRKEIEEERVRLEEERKELEKNRRWMEEQRRRLDETRERMEEELRRLAEERRKMAEERAKAAEPKAEQPPAPKPPNPPEAAPELPKIPPRSARKGGFFIYIDPPNLDALRANGFTLAVADAEGYVSHIVELDPSNRILRLREYGRDDRGSFAEVMFRIRDPGRVKGLSPISRELRRRNRTGSLRLLISRTMYNSRIAPLIREGRAFASRYRLDFDGIRIRVEQKEDRTTWEGIYSQGSFYRR